MKMINKLLLFLLAGLLLGMSMGCSSSTQPADSTEETSTGSSAETQMPEEQDDGMKTIVIYPQSGVTNATVNGIAVISGQENSIRVDTNQSLVTVKYSYINALGTPAEASYDLQTYYDFHVLKANGGWASTMHEGAFENDKVS